jgi:hypothetical protein
VVLRRCRYCLSLEAVADFELYRATKKPRNAGNQPSFKCAVIGVFAPISQLQKMNRTVTCNVRIAWAPVAAPNPAFKGVKRAVFRAPLAVN